ncbi:MAG: hypothetical protein HY660_16945 [Armatimonadetes bacterium]|nr:hypothetical protein [Armatimonadota bacterium]
MSAHEQVTPSRDREAIEIPGVKGVNVGLVWDPGWNPGMMSGAVKIELSLG